MPFSRTEPASASYSRGSELRDRGLARAGGADQRDHPAGFGAEGDVVQNLRAAAGVESGDLFEGGEGDLVGGGVAEADAVELHGHRPVRHPAGVRLLGDQRLQVEDLEDPLEADQGAHHLDTGAGQCGQRGVEAGEQQGEGDDGARVQAAAQCVVAAESVDQGEGQGGHQGEGGDEDGLGHGGTDADVADPAGARGEFGGLVGGPPEEFDEGRAGGGEPFGHLGAHGGVVVGGLALQLGHAGAHPAGGDDEHRQQDEGEQGDLPGDAEHHGERQQQRDEVGDDAGEGVAEGSLGPDDVVVEPADECAGAGAGEEGDRHPLDVVEDRRAQIEDQPLAEGRRQPAGEQSRAPPRRRR